MVGLAYKGGSSAWRESPAMRIAEHLEALGANVRCHDAHVTTDARLGPPVTRVDCSPEELRGANLVVLCVDHPELPLADIAEHAALILDTRGCLRGFEFRGEVL